MFECTHSRVNMFKVLLIVDFTVVRGSECKIKML